MHKTQLAMERSVTGTNLKDRIKSIKIRKLTGTKDIRYIIKKLKLKYAGHVERSTGNKWERQVLYETPYDEGNRRCGSHKFVGARK